MKTYEYNTSNMDKLMTDIFNQFVGTTGVCNPPVNIIELDNSSYLMQIALAGYKKEDIKLSVSGNHLFLSVNKSKLPEGKILRKDISSRAIDTYYNISNREVGKVSFEDGLLSIVLDVPEEKKPREIVIQ